MQRLPLNCSRGDEHINHPPSLSCDYCDHEGALLFFSPKADETTCMWCLIKDWNNTPDDIFKLIYTDLIPVEVR